MINVKQQTIFTLLIIVGAGLLIYDLIAETEIVYLKIAGLVLLMLGLYMSTRQWVDDNKKGDDSEEEENK
ncbi:MAG: hypothetical protein ACQESK_03440 [Bacteroidota bacterium]